MVLLLVLLIFCWGASADPYSFVFNDGFKSGDLKLDGGAHIRSNGLLALFPSDRKCVAFFEGCYSHAFYPMPFVLNNSSSSAFSFSTHFVFQIGTTNHYGFSGLAFVLAPTKTFHGDFRNLGLFDIPGMNYFNHTSIAFPNDNSSYHIIAVHLVGQNGDIFGFHDVGIDVNATTAVEDFPGYHDDYRQSHQLKLQSDQPLHARVFYEDGTITVQLNPFDQTRSWSNSISHKLNLSDIINRNMYVGFTTVTEGIPIYVLGWSFAVDEITIQLINTRLPRVPRKPIEFFKFGLPTIVLVPCLVVLAIYVRRKIKYAEVMEDWELEYISHRFKYKDLYTATQGFNDTHMVGKGGFGKVYRGVLPGSKIDVAVKRISLESKQGIKEFVAEIVTIGRLRHRNLTPLLGYCRRKKEFLLVYEYMPNGSLENHIHGHFNAKLDWPQRFHIIKGIAYGLFFLHEEWEQVVIHRDIKPSNVLLDTTWSARLGDFGLAKLHDRGSDPSTTKIVGTLGYIAPEHTQTGKATTGSDIYGFGALMLEVATGRRPIGSNGRLVEWVHSLWTENKIRDVIDPSLVGNLSKKEAEFVLKLGLLCSHILPQIRPSMKDIIGYLDDPSTLPEHLLSNAEDFFYYRRYDDASSSMVPSISSFRPTNSFSISNSLTVCGR